MELYKEDLDVAAEMLVKLDELACMPHLYEIEIRFRANDGPWITVGFGEAGDPCIIKIEPARTPPLPPLRLDGILPHTYKTTINEADFNSL